MALPDGVYYIDSPQSTNVCAIGSNDAYETIRTLPDTHAPQPVRFVYAQSALHAMLTARPPRSGTCEETKAGRIPSRTAGKRRRPSATPRSRLSPRTTSPQNGS